MNKDTKNPPFLWINKWINLTNKAGDVFLNERFRPFHVNYTQFIVLGCVIRNDGISQLDISRTTLYDKGTVTRSLDHLEELHYVTRKRDETDRRLVRVYATAEGWEIFHKHLEVISEWNQKILENMQLPFELTKEQIHQLQFALACAAVKAVTEYDDQGFEDWERRINWTLNDLEPPVENDL